MGAGIRKPKPPNLVPENGREVESNIVEISPEDHEFYQHSSSSNDNDDAHHKKKHHHHPSSTHNEQHQKNNRTHDLHLIDFQDQEIPTKEFDDRQNSIRMPSELSKNEKKTKTHEEQHKKIDEYHVLSLDTEALNIPLYSLGETSPERKQSRQKILDSLVISSDDHRRQSKDRNDIKAETITKERSHSPVLRPSSSKTSSPPRSASTKIRLSPQKEKSTSVLHPSHHFSIPDISFQRKSPSPVESSKFEPAPPDLDSSPVNTSLTIQDDVISPRTHNNGYLTSPRDTSLEIRHKSHHNSVSNSRKNSMEASPPTPFYNKSKHEAVFHQLQINELRNSLDDDHVNSLIDEPKTSSPPIPHLLTSISSTPTEVSLVSPSLRSDLDDDEAAALMGHGKIVQKIKKENKLLLELQRQRTVSTMQNAKVFPSFIFSLTS